MVSFCCDELVSQTMSFLVAFLKSPTRQWGLFSLQKSWKVSHRTVSERLFLHQKGVILPSGWPAYVRLLKSEKGLKNNILVSQRNRLAYTDCQTPEKSGILLLEKNNKWITKKDLPDNLEIINWRNQVSLGFRNQFR